MLSWMIRLLQLCIFVALISDLILCMWDFLVILEPCGERVGNVGVRACRSIVKDEAGFARGIVWFFPSLFFRRGGKVVWYILSTRV